MQNINNLLKSMRSSGKIQDWKGKGTFGEDAVFTILHKYCLHCGGSIYRSFKYPYASNSHNKYYLGNIFRNADGTYYDITKQLNDEIDVLLITPYRVFAVEVKAYHAKLEAYDHWLRKNGTDEEKSPITQAEKHARHLYHQIYDSLPEGNPNYIRPVVCFVDRCTVDDKRSQPFRTYSPVTILDTLIKCIADNDTPLNHRINIQDVNRKLEKIKI
jgi:hypothetical protein